MATFYTAPPQNIALHGDVWTLTLAEAKAVLPYLDIQEGSYWNTTVATPYHAAVQTKERMMHIYTYGVGSGELLHALYASGATIARESNP